MTHYNLNYGELPVIIKKSCYLKKSDALFNDQEYYKKIKIKSNPSSLERKTNDLVKWLNKMDFSGANKQLLPVLQKFSISKAYGLIKIHKAGFPVKPIISTVNSPPYHVSKFFAKFLQNNLKTPSSHVDNSLKLKEKL